jgi:hypothetical protein
MFLKFEHYDLAISEFLHMNFEATFFNKLIPKIPQNPKWVAGT